MEQQLDVGQFNLSTACSGLLKWLEDSIAGLSRSGEATRTVVLYQTMLPQTMNSKTLILKWLFELRSKHKYSDSITYLRSYTVSHDCVKALLNDERFTSCLNADCVNEVVTRICFNYPVKEQFFIDPETLLVVVRSLMEDIQIHVSVDPAAKKEPKLTVGKVHMLELMDENAQQLVNNSRKIV